MLKLRLLTNVGAMKVKNTVEQIVKWLQDEVKAAGVQGLLVGVSGGLDSAVVASLIKRAFPEDSLGVPMPLHSNPKDMEDALMVIKDTQINSVVIDLTETHDVMYSHINKQLQIKGKSTKKSDRLADANLRARLRMSALYTLATHYNYLVVGTDNQSEWYTGYFTKYGDGGVDLLPIVDFTKTEVSEMARYLGVPNDIIDKDPSADLWEGQTDEEEMGITYVKIDAYLKGEHVPEQDRILIERMHKQTEHKRRTAKQFIRKSDLIS